MLPFDSVVMTCRRFKSDSPSTTSGQGLSRCHTRLSARRSFSGRSPRPKRGRMLSRISRCRSSIFVHPNSPERTRCIAG